MNAQRSLVSSPPAQRVAAEHLRLIGLQVARVPVLVVLVDAFVVWLLSREGLLLTGVIWMAVQLMLQALRWMLARRYTANAAVDVVQALHRLSLMFGLIGVSRAAIVPLLFAQPLTDTHYVFTMVFLGLAAGGVSSVAGYLRAYLMWAVPVAVALATGWMLQGSFEGRSVGVLMLLMFGVLSLYVRDEGRTLARLIQLAHEKDELASSLRVERDRAQAANESKTRFFAAASHDLRQPLHALSINATTLELVARKQSDPMVRELSQSINRALRQSNSLLDGLLDISRLDANAIELHIEPISVRSTFEALKDEFEASAAQLGLALRFDLPAGADPWVASDADLLMRILGNLVSNALKFTTQGEVVLAARHAGGDADVEPAALLLSVTDTGAGIPAAEHERVFEEFYQIGNPSRDRSRGLGLGLSIVKRAAALLGVGLQLDSVPGRGTRIELRVPAAAPPRTAAPVVSAEAASTDALPTLSARVLVIDDEEEVLESLGVLLPHLGCEVRCATGSTQAHAILESGFVPELLVVDHRLRNESGSQVIEQLRHRLGPVPALMVTGDTAPENLQRALASGVRVVHKPLDGARLAHALAETLERTHS
jgi:signal transduction histidine kinase